MKLKRIDRERLYTSHAKYFDLLYSKAKYRKQLSALRHLFSLADHPVHSVYDVACGTGTLLSLLDAAGYVVAGSDKHSEMIRLAKQKLPTKNIVVAPMTVLALTTRYDAVTCMGAINYCLSVRELDTAIRGFGKIVRPGGILVIGRALVDGHAPRLNRVHLNKSLRGEVSKIGIWSTAESRSICNVESFIAVRDKNDAQISRDTHKLRIFTIDEIKRAISKAGLVPGIYDEQTLTGRICKNKPVIFVGIRPQRRLTGARRGGTVRAG